MMDGTGTFWSWHRGENGQDDWTAWRGSNTGFNHHISSVSNKPLPMRIVEGPRVVVSWAQVRFNGTEVISVGGGETTVRFLQLLGVG